MNYCALTNIRAAKDYQQEYFSAEANPATLAERLLLKSENDIPLQTPHKKSVTANHGGLV